MYPLRLLKIVASSVVLSFYFIILQSISEADVQKQCKSHQCKGKVTTLIHVPKERELVCLISLALFGTLGIPSFPDRNFVSSSYVQCSFPDAGEVDSINRVLQCSGAEQLDAFLLLL